MNVCKHCGEDEALHGPNFEPTQSWEVGTKFKIVLVCPDRAPDYYAIEYIPNGHRTGFYDNEREANERMDELAWIYAQGLAAKEAEFEKINVRLMKAEAELAKATDRWEKLQEFLRNMD